MSVIVRDVYAISRAGRSRGRGKGQNFGKLTLPTPSTVFGQQCNVAYREGSLLAYYVEWVRIENCRPEQAAKLINTGWAIWPASQVEEKNGDLRKRETGEWILTRGFGSFAGSADPAKIAKYWQVPASFF